MRFLSFVLSLFVCFQSSVSSAAVIPQFPKKIVNFESAAIGDILWEGDFALDSYDYGRTTSKRDTTQTDIVLEATLVGVPTELTEDGVLILGDSGLGMVVTFHAEMFLNRMSAADSDHLYLHRNSYREPAYDTTRRWMAGLSAMTTTGLSQRVLSAHGKIALIKLAERFKPMELRPHLMLALYRNKGTNPDMSQSIVNPSVTSVVTTQECRISSGSGTIDFGQVKSVGEAGEKARLSSHVSLVCTAGDDVLSTKATYSMTPGVPFGTNTRAIGLTMSDGSVSDSLYVQGFSENASNIACGSSTALESGKPVDFFTEAGGNVNRRGALRWLLCRKKSTPALPLGKFNGSATITVFVE